jgi:peptide/nickel transport system substrate-binding protein
MLSTTTDYVDICEYVQHQFSNFGIPVKVDVLPASVHRERSARGDLIFFRKSWLADYPDDENFMALFYSRNKVPNGPNYSQYSNPVFDALYDRALTTVDREARIDLYREMDSLMMQSAPVMPLYYDEVVRILRRDVEGLDKNPLNVLDLRKVKVGS